MVPATQTLATPGRCTVLPNTPPRTRPSSIARSIPSGTISKASARFLAHLAGFSAGAAMAVVMAAAYPELFASVGIHSGLGLGAAHDIPSAMAVMRSGNAPAAPARDRRTARLQIPTIIFHGDRDTTVHPRNGEHITQQWAGPDEHRTASDSGSADSAVLVERGQVPGGRSYTRRILGGTADRPLLEHWRLHGSGHGWSGGSQAGSHTDPRDPDASREMVRFFTQNPRRSDDQTTG